MSKLKHESTTVISQRQLRKIIMILSDRWSETREFVETRNSTAQEFQQNYDFWIEQISL